MTRRRRRPRAHTNHERWLVSYADFITLLFAFFVVLYASSQVDQRKVGKLALAIQVAFQEMGVFPASTTQIPLDLNDPMPFSTVQAIQNVERTAEIGRIASAPKGGLSGSSDDTDLATLRGELEQALHAEIALHQVSLHRDTEGLVISLREFGFFDSGSAAIKPEALPALDRIASILAIRTCNLRIEGHTDNVPIHTPTIASNWELSTNRATELVRLLIVGHGRRLRRISSHRQQSHRAGPRAEPPGRYRHPQHSANCTGPSVGGWRQTLNIAQLVPGFFTVPVLQGLRFFAIPGLRFPSPNSSARLCCR